MQHTLPSKLILSISDTCDADSLINIKTDKAARVVETSEQHSTMIFHLSKYSFTFLFRRLYETILNNFKLKVNTKIEII